MNIFLLFVLCRSILDPKLKVFQIESILKVEYLLKPQDCFGHLQFWRENSNHFDDDLENVIYRYAHHCNVDIMHNCVCHIRNNFLFFYSCLAYFCDSMWLRKRKLARSQKLLTLLFLTFWIRLPIFSELFTSYFSLKYFRIFIWKKMQTCLYIG